MVEKRAPHQRCRSSVSVLAATGRRGRRGERLAVQPDLVCKMRTSPIGFSQVGHGFIFGRARPSHLASPEHDKKSEVISTGCINSSWRVPAGALFWLVQHPYIFPGTSPTRWNPAAIYHELSLPNDMSPSLPALTHSQSIVAQPEHLGEWHAGERNVQAYKALPTRTLFYAWTWPKVVREARRRN